MLGKKDCKRNMQNNKLRGIQRTWKFLFCCTEIVMLSKLSKLSFEVIDILKLYRR